MYSQHEIEKKVLSGDRVSEAEAMWLHEQAPLDWLGALAHEVRLRLNPNPWVTYNVDRNINYSDICTARCSFCAFYTPETSPEGYVLTWGQIREKLQELVEIGGKQVLLQGGLHPDYEVTWYEDLLRRIKQEFPEIWIHGFSAPEIVKISEVSGLDYYSTILRLKAAGLDSLPGGGAEILVSEVRDLMAVGKCTGSEWIEVHRQCHRADLATTSTMMFGSIEKPEHRIEHLRMLRELQDETGGFTAFITWPYQPDNTPLKKRVPRAATAVEYLRMNAVSRVYLDNIPHIQSSWVTQGEKIGQLALFYGADDFGSVMMEENVVSAAGIVHHLNEEKIRRSIERAGFQPMRRGMRYDIQEPEPAAAV